MPFSWRTLPVLLALPASILAVTLDCEDIRVDKQSFDLSPLGGPKEVHRQEYQPPSIFNTTFTIDICNPLKRKKEVPSEFQCPSGTRVCGVEQTYHLADGTNSTDRVIPIAGEYTTTFGPSLDPHYERLKGGSSHEDAEREGIRITLNGGRYPIKERNGVKQKAIIEFVCNRDVSGNEGFEDNEEGESLVRRGAEDDDDDDGEPKLPDLDTGKNLHLVSQKIEDDVEVLRLRWDTKFACEGVADEEPEDGGKKKKTTSGWGFFTWFIIM